MRSRKPSMTRDLNKVVRKDDWIVHLCSVRSGEKVRWIVEGSRENTWLVPEPGPRVARTSGL